jgi:outer membrane biogenesis lipoprotein LolB
LRKVLILIAALINFLIILPGCVPSKPTDEVEILPSERLINKLEVNRRKIKSFEGNGTLNVRANGMNQSATFNVVLQKPDSLYLTIMGPFGIELAQAVVTNENFLFYDALQNTAYQGETDSNILQEIFNINLSFSELMDAFIGSVNLTGNLYQAPDEYNIDYDKYVLTYIDPESGKKTIYRVDIRELGITDYYVFDNTGYEILEGKYSKFDLHETVAVPYKIEVQNKEESQRIIIDYKTIKVNKSNIAINFKLPHDATVIKW